jgi:hypothetical protein
MIETNAATIRVVESGAGEPALVFCTIGAVRHELGKPSPKGSQEKHAASPSTNAAGVNLPRRTIGTISPQWPMTSSLSGKD